MLLRLFPVLAVVAAMAGYAFTSAMAPWGGAIVPLLTVIMLCMGLTLTPQDFLELREYRKAMLAGICLQFSVMPLTALLIAMVFGLSNELTVGLVLVGSVAGGTSSNVMTYIARGNVALSVSMTAISTLMSVVMTPILLTLLVGSTIDVPAANLLRTLVQIILLPVIAGVMINHFAHAYVSRVQPVLAPMAVAAILVIIAIVVALNASALAGVALIVAGATLAHNVFGLIFGYSAARLLGFDRAVCRTIAIEVGMQNSGLATALAIKFFSPLAALPGTIFSIWLNITGSVFAALSLWIDSRNVRLAKASGGDLG